jgi:hypothetical protein
MGKYWNRKQELKDEEETKTEAETGGEAEDETAEA